MLSELRATGDRVQIATVRPEDAAPYRAAVHASAARLSRWNPVDPDDLGRHLKAQSSTHRTFIIRARDPQGSHGIVGKVNVTNVVRGRFHNGTLGYDAYDPYAGRGLFAEGLQLAVDLAFAPEPRGLGLHRLEANVQPGNVASAGVLRSLGFRREGHVPRMLWLADGSAESQWRDHDAYAITADEWPTEPYAPHEYRRVAVLVNGIPGSGKSTLARALSRELVLPLLRVEDAGAGVWDVLADSPGGGVVELDPGRDSEAIAGLAAAGIDPPHVLQVWCEPRTEGHRPGAPIDLPETIRVDPDEPLNPRDVTRAALQARAIGTTRR